MKGDYEKLYAFRQLKNKANSNPISESRTPAQASGKKKVVKDTKK